MGKIEEMAEEVRTRWKERLSDMCETIGRVQAEIDLKNYAQAYILLDKAVDELTYLKVGLRKTAQELTE